MLAQQRRDRLLAEMRKEGIEAIVAFGTNWQEAYLRYVSDFCILEGSGIAILTADGRCRLFLESVAEAERASGETSVEVALVRNLAQTVGDALASVSNQHVLAAPPALMPSWLTSKERRFRLDDGTTLIDRLMMEKMPAEIDAMRRAAVLADEGYGYFREAARVGRRQYEVVADVEQFLRTKGSPDNFMIIGSGGVDVRGMAPPSERRLKEGDLVTTELTPAVDGYFSQICRTLVLGKASAAQAKAFAVYHEAMEAGIAAVRPGVTAADVARAENDVFRKHGLGDYVTNKYTRVRGHGLGLMCDLKPNILEDVNIELKEGMTIIVHPNTYHPDAGYIVLGDMVVVTATGCERLTRTPAKLFEIPV
ncbi:MAG TPA: Xaa-Pro peptidase family protein [Xanthobacteraceae bacterium]|nr:Xaa-Pro peptidase family protein [Xanthobacteraceae bacterium]